MSRKYQLVFSLAIVLALFLGACTPAITTDPIETETSSVATEELQVETEETVVETEQVVTATEEPQEEPTAEVQESSPEKLILATTTSTYDSGLLDFILPAFESEYGVEVDVIAVGTGQALELGVNGDTDVLLVHARSREDEFMAQKHAVRREDVMYNDFVIVGPPSDPAGIRGLKSALDALKAITNAESPFVSRGDDSGTHIKEKAIWTEAGIEPSGDWYFSAGQGMGAVLTMADEQKAYTLSDRATYLARTLEGIDLEIIVEGDPILFNPYGVMAVNPEKNPAIKVELAQSFIDWLISVSTQEMISQFGVEEFGQPLFIPDSQPWRDTKGTAVGDVEVALNVIGFVTIEQAWTLEQISSQPTMEVEYTNKNGETATYTGVLISELLNLAEPKAEAATLEFVANDGYSAEVSYDEIQACTNCILAIDDDGTLRLILPDFPSNLQIKDVVEFIIK